MKDLKKTWITLHLCYDSSVCVCVHACVCLIVLLLLSYSFRPSELIKDPYRYYETDIQCVYALEIHVGT